MAASTAYTVFLGVDCSLFVCLCEDFAMQYKFQNIHSLPHLEFVFVAVCLFISLAACLDYFNEVSFNYRGKPLTSLLRGLPEPWTCVATADASSLSWAFVSFPDLSVKLPVFVRLH